MMSAGCFCVWWHTPLLPEAEQLDWVALLHSLVLHQRSFLPPRPRAYSRSWVCISVSQFFCPPPLNHASFYYDAPRKPSPNKLPSGVVTDLADKMHTFYLYHWSLRSSPLYWNPIARTVCVTNHFLVGCDQQDCNLRATRWPHHF